MTELKIPGNIFNQIVAQAKAEAPIEACSILAGKDGLIKKFYKMTNVDQSKTHFMMLPEEQFKVIKDIRSNGLEMLAICHSHPESPVRPSEEDIRLALTPEVAYVIVSLVEPDEPDIKAFKIEGSIVSQTPITIVKDL